MSVLNSPSDLHKIITPTESEDDYNSDFDENEVLNPLLTNEDVKHLLFPLLSLPDLKTCRQVCKSWDEICIKIIKKKYKFSLKPINLFTIKSIQRFNETFKECRPENMFYTKFNFNRSNPVPENPEFEKLDSAEDVDFFIDNFGPKLTEMGINVLEMSLDGLIIGKMFMKLATKFGENIEKLTFNFLFRDYKSDFFGDLIHCSQTNPNSQINVKEGVIFPKLKYLSIIAPFAKTDNFRLESIIEFLKNCPNLETFESGMNRKNFALWTNALENFENSEKIKHFILQSANDSSIMELTDLSIKKKLQLNSLWFKDNRIENELISQLISQQRESLQVLRIEETAEADGVLQFEKMKNVKHLQISFLVNFLTQSQVIIPNLLYANKFPNLQRIHFSNFKGFESSLFSPQSPCPTLTELHLKQTTSVEFSTEFLLRIFEIFPKLKVFNLDKANANCIQIVLPLLWTFWNDTLEDLSLYFICKEDNSYFPKDLYLDSLFTGIPSEEQFNDELLQNSALRLKKLKRLKFGMYHKLRRDEDYSEIDLELEMSKKFLTDLTGRYVFSKMNSLRDLNISSKIQAFSSTFKDHFLRNNNKCALKISKM